ncbi:hypothetical protein P0E39_14080 [Enterococcus faecalis]|uniref:hypothetical protein n=1 Tax=Enterococcus faecalis TaxID=1351 RepID=UPI0025B26525|nr:hypothetical protein [Enterococcus faecalis]MDN3095861.1 hypothetical protein [Enterococcus faecalis]
MIDAQDEYVPEDAPRVPGFAHAGADSRGLFLAALIQLRRDPHFKGDILLSALRVAVGDPDYEFQSPVERAAWKTMAFTVLYGYTKN